MIKTNDRYSYVCSQAAFIRVYKMKFNMLPIKLNCSLTKAKKTVDNVSFSVELNKECGQCRCLRR